MCNVVKSQFVMSLMALIVCWSGVLQAAESAQVSKADAPVVYPPETEQLRAGSNANWGGLQIFNVTLKRVQ